ncbi:ABC transporter permease [Haloplanus ruber]|uniref:ABC transporter permease n=1 Tax=Haloplanus ruber TaxID=869892 RepID=A0ABD6D303_9EURY|nr:hypothetical protein [Haloplanus ruber]
MSSIEEALRFVARRIARLRGRSPGSIGGGALIVLAVLAAAGWYFRPWLHGIVYAVYTTPILPLALLVAGGVVYALRRRTTLVGPQAVLAVFLLVLVVGSGITGLLAGERLGKSTLDAATTADSLDETNSQMPRVVPKSVAARYASNTLNFPQYRISGSDVTVNNGTPYWSYALAPDGAYNHFTKRQHGTVLIDMTQQNAEVRTVTDDLERGIGPAFYNNYRFELLKRGQYLVDYGDPFMVVNEGEQYIAVPYTTPTFHWVPLPYTTPEWGGVALIDSDGNVEDLSPAEARSHSALEEQRLYPSALARKKVATTKYRRGIVNTFTSHEDEIEVAPVPGANNDQPFLVFTEDGPEYIVAVEPYGEAQGLKEVWTVDSRTGDYEMYTPDRSLFGARKATDYVRQAARTTDWNRFSPSEPIPVVVDGQLYWQVRVVPSDSSGIAYIAFVNARSSDVREVSTTREVVAFLEGDTGTVDSGGAADSRDPSLIVQRVAPNGTVVGTLEVYGNESVRVVQGNATATNATATG